MDHPRNRPIPNLSARGSDAVPESQSRALERRQSLDQQQRTLRKSGPGPHTRSRPPA